jgi:hypothetical protein
MRVCVCVCCVACARSYVYVTRACWIICVCAKSLQDFNSHSATHFQTRSPDAVPNNLIPTSSSVTTILVHQLAEIRNQMQRSAQNTQHSAIIHRSAPRGPHALPAADRQKGLLKRRLLCGPCPSTLCSSAHAGGRRCKSTLNE